MQSESLGEDFQRHGWELGTLLQLKPKTAERLAPLDPSENPSIDHKNVFHFSGSNLVA